METPDSGVMESWNGVFIAVITLLICALISFAYKFFSASKTGSHAEEIKSEADSNVASESTEQTLESRPSKSKKRPTAWKSKSEYSHPWLLKSLKGHTGNVLDIDLSSNGKFLASTCEDGSVMIWDVRDLNQKELKSLRVNIEYDHATFVVWSPDCKAFVIHKARDNCIQVYKVEKKKDGMIGSASPVVAFNAAHDDDVIGFGISSNGRFMMSCSNKTDLIVWDLKGQHLANLDTYLMSTYSAKISPCGRFVVATGFTPDVKVMEVVFTRTGEYKQTVKAFELTGHSSGVYDVAFDVDTSHIATISKDGTWKLYHTKIEYTRGESPHVLSTGTYATGAGSPKISLSPDAEVLAVAVNSTVHFYDTYTAELFHTIPEVFSGPITAMQFDASGKSVWIAGDRAVRIFHNVCGYSTAAQRCARQLATKQTSATVERLKATVQECKEALAKFGK